ncbi:MAG: SRPBCC domain-containing protein [Candidatus Woesebacteria bacterium]
MKPITQTYVIHSTLENVWQALIDPKMIDGWGGGPAKMSDKRGALFSLWGGDVHGKNLEVHNEAQLVQEWIGWKDETLGASKLTLDLTEKNGVTTVKLTHENVPESEYKEVKKGWKDFYFGPLKTLLEKNS